MRLDKVEIVGFKSFCDRQELSFNGGVTGIVGPNGCGKSNIADAISWALGEQSAKSLRGISMGDVIFGGSQSRQAVGMAEVNLKVSRLNGSSPDGLQECIITRRLYRDGESEYLMNGRLCRLRDVHELFMDTGLGSKAYSIIEQGKIGQILSSKPTDRRALIEEAAGITKYKTRRRQTQLKLEAANQNLLRVTDIVLEVEKQLESLKRQAAKARRYRALRQESQGIESVLFGRRFLELQAQQRNLEERLASEAEREGAATTALEAEETGLETSRNVLYGEETRLSDARARLSEITLAVERHQGRTSYCKEQSLECERRQVEAQREAEDLSQRLEPLTASLEARRREHERVKGEAEAAEAEARGAEAAVADALAHENVTEARQEADRDARVGLMARMAALGNSRESHLAAAERAAAELVKLAAETAELERETNRAAGERQRIETASLELESRLLSLQQAREQADARSAESRGQANALAEEARSLQRDRDTLAGRLASLEEIIITHSAFGEGVRALLSRPDGIEVGGVLADAIETDATFERAVEAFLGERLQAVLVSDDSAALRGIAYLRDLEAGRGALLALASGRRECEPPDLRAIARQEPGVKAILSDVYRLTGPHAGAIAGALPDALVVDTLETAAALAERHPRASFVSLAGDTLYGPMLAGGRPVKGLLAPRREARELRTLLDEIDVLLASAREGAEAEQGRADAATAEVRRLEESIHASEKDLVALRRDGAAADEDRTRLKRKAFVLDTERSQTESERQTASSALVEIENALVAAEAEAAMASERLAEAAVRVADARAQAELAQARLSEARSRIAALRERVAAGETECQRIAESQRETQDRLAATQLRLAEIEARQQDLRREMLDAERSLAQALLDRDRVLAELAVAEERVREMRDDLEARELAVKERRRERDVLREARSDLEIAHARNESDLDHLARECHGALGATPAEIAGRLSEEDQSRSEEELGDSLRQLREKLDRLGPVNVLAVEQAQELEERHVFLTTQRQDLTDAIDELERSLRTIDRTSRERFRDAFQAINGHFGDVFRRLFGGGTAGLSLTDEEDLLESGIDVMAQPPGKRLQNVLLLSGGEKALTAIALLFAIFHYKPSPFCILDEVDAPLDDANIGRFVRLLDTLRDQTQFVLITHSQKTMQIADQLYGVTMEEPGVSKLVSVKFS